MARIPDEFINEVLARTDMVSVVRQYVPGLKKSGSSYMGLCPFHEEKSPSFSINPDKNLYHCFGCGAGGNTIGFLMRKSGMAYMDTLRELAEQAGLELPRQGGLDPDAGNRQHGAYEALGQAADFYQKQLHSDAGKVARDYLKQRGVDGETAKLFELGYAPQGWDNLSRRLKVPEELLLQAGLVKPRDNGRGCYDVFRDRLVFPIRSHVRGRVVAFGARALRDEDKPKYLNSPESEVFSKRREWYGLHRLKASNRARQVFVVEGYMDVVSMVGHGLPEAVASLGTAVSVEQLQTLFRFFPSVVFCFDGDAAGRKAAHRAMENLLPMLHADIDVRFMFLPEGHDPDSMVRESGPDALRQLQDSMGALDFLRQHLRGGDKAPAGADAKARLIHAARETLAGLRDPIIRGVMVANMAEDFAMQAESVEQMLEAGKDSFRPPAQAVDADENPKPLMSHVVSLLLQEPGLMSQYREQVEAFPEVKEREFFMEWLDVVTRNPEISGGGMLEHWRGSSYGERLQGLAATPMLLQDANSISRELNDAMRRLDLSLCRKRRKMLLVKGLGELSQSQAEELRALRRRIGGGGRQD